MTSNKSWLSPHFCTWQYRISRSVCLELIKQSRVFLYVPEQSLFTDRFDTFQRVKFTFTFRRSVQSENLYLDSVYTFLSLVRYFFFCHQNTAKKMDLSSILSVIHTVTFGTMLNLNGGGNGHGIKMLRVNRPFIVFQHCDVRLNRSFS